MFSLLPPRPRPLGTPSKITSKLGDSLPKAERPRHFTADDPVFRIKLSKKVYGVRSKGVLGYPRGRIKLSPAIVEWLAANCQSEYRIYEPAGKPEFKVNFASEAEAAMFKVVWG